MDNYNGEISSGEKRKQMYAQPENSNLFVNYIPPEVDDAQLLSLFQPFGEIDSCKVMVDLNTNQSRCFGFVKFKEIEDATKALQTMNGHSVGSKTLVVKYANASNNPTIGTSSENIFVKGLPTVITKDQLQQLFSHYGTIVDVKLLTDPNTKMSRGLGFIVYAGPKEAENAIKALNGHCLPGTIKPIVVRYADTEDEKLERKKKLIHKRMRLSTFGLMPDPTATYDNSALANAYNQSSAAASNPMLATGLAVSTQYPAQNFYQHMVLQNTVGQNETNLFIYNLPADAQDGLLYRLFSRFGAIESVKIVRDASGSQCKGFGFVKMVHWADACTAIQQMNGYKLNDRTLQVSFKKNKPGQLDSDFGYA
eukprot:TRINITY_DN6370_c1_g1_i1.p1 TRINITY_DN6370_c1_g1~~TRINITY_DN6370_c1_g1_i1.p1  ORF type:complete len:366 (+),score=166.73 TRINITY_DN6370_c1_g1_i1:51-1148(+)